MRARPAFDPVAISRLKGKYRNRMAMTSDEDRRQAREEQADDEVSGRSQRAGP